MVSVNYKPIDRENKHILGWVISRVKTLVMTLKYERHQGKNTHRHMKFWYTL